MGYNVKLNLENLGCEVVYLYGKTSIKTRLIDTRSNQQLMRIDKDIISDPLELHQIKYNLEEFDAIVISDYEKGFVSYDLITELRKKYNGPIFLDTKKTDLFRFEGCYVKINALEFSRTTSLCSELIITRGEKGADYKEINYPAKTVEVVDICGAGDTFLSALVYKYLNTREMANAIEFAILASSVTVQHSGVYAPSLEEIK
jgi:D-beta-D-heptose 7-phosphate kinase/D-beta-D-heptose 1-phosphate adenosyltransferase